MEITKPGNSQEDYLALAYAHQQEVGGKYVPFLDILKEVLEDSITSDEAATRVSTFVFSHNDFLSIYSGVLSTIIGAAHQLSEQRDLSKLAGLVSALSRLPDDRNDSNKTLHLYLELESYDIAPQEVIEVDDGKIWCDLPCFHTELGDSMRGPTAYINDGIPEHIAEQQWTNLNTFAACLISNRADSPRSFDYLYTFAFRCITDSLEWDARTEQGMFSLYSLPAAMRWLCIAGQKVWENGTWCVAGPLWRGYCEGEEVEVEDGGNNGITLERWLWWAERLEELGESNMIDEEAKALAGSCAEMIREWAADDSGPREGNP
ncbi:unnamed protein product [Aureobasidium uvarum]|uniref:Uncharacterized protein n=1 Tax=Aureobasidium uvarum TaxID=2773716 RepID=A0A9N8PRP7_9PEZI|nr:unnamed protein product [Aureobasidium uvarum]